MFCSLERSALISVSLGEAGRMRKISEFHDHNAECRKMAARPRNLTHKARFEEIARAWEMLAETRIKQLEQRLLRRSHARLHRRDSLESHL
jgi:hypothetical protein